MFSLKLLIIAGALLCVSARYVVLEDENGYLLPIETLEDLEVDELVPARTGRLRRQAQGSVTVKSDGTSGANLMVPLKVGENNALSAVGSVDLTNKLKVAQSSVGLSLDNVNGHSLSLSHSKLPGADRLTAAGNLNLFQNENHKLDANAFAARTMPEQSHFPNFNTYGAGAEYMYKNKVGVEANVFRTPKYDQTDYSAMGKLNLFRNRDTSIDFKAGLSKSFSPFMPKSSWEPSSIFSVTRRF